MADNGQWDPEGCWLSMRQADTHSRHGWKSSILRPTRGKLPHSNMPKIKINKTHTPSSNGNTSEPVGMS